MKQRGEWPQMQCIDVLQRKVATKLFTPGSLTRGYQTRAIKYYRVVK